MCGTRNKHTAVPVQRMMGAWPAWSIISSNEPCTLIHSSTPSGWVIPCSGCRMVMDCSEDTRNGTYRIWRRGEIGTLKNENHRRRNGHCIAAGSCLQRKGGYSLPTLQQQFEGLTMVVPIFYNQVKNTPLKKYIHSVYYTSSIYTRHTSCRGLP